MWTKAALEMKEIIEKTEDERERFYSNSPAVLRGISYVKKLIILDLFTMLIH